MAFDQAKADEICATIADGVSVRQACIEHGQNRSELYKWLRKNPDFADQYARAKEESAEPYAEEMLDIADDGRNDWEERENARTGETYIALNREAIERSRLRIETRKWIASKLKPKKYGDKVQHDVDGKLEITLVDATKRED